MDSKSEDTQKLHYAFYGATLKIERAKRHINEVKSLIDWLQGDHVERFVINYDSEGNPFATFNDFGKFSAELSLVVGDTVHNLRTALDHVWTALERQATGKFTTFATFPFHETRENLKDILAESPVKAAFPQVEGLILNHVKPHWDEGGNGVLWALTKLDKLDKHNIIIPILAVSYVRKFSAMTKSGGIIPISDCVISGHGAVGFSDAPEFERQHSEITVTPEFPVGTVLSCEPILPTLVYLAETTEKAVKLFGKTLLG